MDKIEINPFAVKRYTLVTRLSVEKCGERLKSLTMPSWFSREFWHIFWHTNNPQKRPVRGKVHQNGFQLCQNREFYSSYQTVASGRFFTDQDYTRIVVKLSLDPLVIVIGLLIILFQLFISFIIIVAWLFHLGYWSMNPLFAVILVALIMPVFFIGLYLQGRYLSRNESDFLIKFLKETLEAEELT